MTDRFKQAETYVLRYGGMCRDCADENGVCPNSGIVCDSEQRRKMVRHALEALEYGSKHGFIKLPFTALSDAYEVGRREERETLERTLKSIRARSAYHPDETVDDLKRQMRHINSVSDAAIRSREVKE